MKTLKEISQAERINYYENKGINDDKNGCQMCGSPILELINDTRLCPDCYSE